MMRRVASMPSMPGMRTSMSTTSGARSAHRATASTPSAASPPDLEALGRVDDHPQPGADEVLVVGEEHADAHAHRTAAR